MVQESSPGVSRGGPGGGGQRCPICLEPISGEGFLDQCFHKFCYHCILQWSEMVISRPSSNSNRLQYLECPLCKTQYTSIIHDVFESKFQRHYILTPCTPGCRLLKSEAHIRRQTVYSAPTGPASLQPSRSIDVVPKPNRWISCWVQRELQALMQEEDVDTVMHHVIGIVESFNNRSKEKVGSSGKQGTKSEGLSWHATISAAVRPFIFEYAESFAVELESFLVSGLDIAAYDQRCKLATGAREPVPHSDEETTLCPLKKDFQNIYDLYDEDVDEQFGHVMVRTASSEPESYTREESSEMVKQHTRVEDPGIQEGKSSQGELTLSRKTKKDSIKGSVKESRSSLDRGRGKHRSESRKKRSRSRSSSSRSSSPPRHKRRKRHKITKYHSRKKRKPTKRKDKKALQEHKRKSHKSRLPKNIHGSSDKSSESKSSRSSRSLSPPGSGARRNARKEDRTFAEKPVSEEARSRKVQSLDVEQQIRDRRKSPHRYRSSSSERPETNEKGRSDELVPDNVRKHQQPSSSHRGGQEFEVKDTYAMEANEISLTCSPEVGLNDTNALELKLREQALENLMRHLSQKKSATESDVGIPEDSVVAKGNQNFDVPSAAEEMMMPPAPFQSKNVNDMDLDGVMEVDKRGYVEINLKNISQGVNHVPCAAEEMKPPAPFHSKNVNDGALEGVMEGDKQGYLEINVRNISQGVNHVPEAGEDADSNTDFMRQIKDDKKGTAYSTGSRSSSQAVEETTLEVGQSSGVSCAKTTSLEGRDIVVELVVDAEPFDFEIPFEGSTLYLVTDDQRGKMKVQSNRELSRQVTEGNSIGRENRLTDGEVSLQQVLHPQLGVPVTKSPLEHRQEILREKKLSDVETGECGNRKELTLLNPERAGISGELTHDVERTDAATFREESAKNQSSSEKTRSYLNDVSGPKASPKACEDADVGNSDKFLQKSMSVTRGGESVQVSYKVYIPQRAAAPRRRLQR